VLGWFVDVSEIMAVFFSKAKFDRLSTVQSVTVDNIHD
jgi:hypothetical protein